MFIATVLCVHSAIDSKRALRFWCIEYDDHPLHPHPTKKTPKRTSNKQQNKQKTLCITDSVCGENPFSCAINLFSSWANSLVPPGRFELNLGMLCKFYTRLDNWWLSSKQTGFVIGRTNIESFVWSFALLSRPGDLGRHCARLLSL